MRLVATLASPALSQHEIDAARTVLTDAPVYWLAGGRAADLHFSGTDPIAIEAALRAALGDAPVDLLVQPVEGRRKHLFIADMDSTMIGQECIDELAAELGLKPRIAAITERAMRGEIAFEPAVRERVGLLAGLDAGVVDRIIANRITLTPGGRELVMTMRANGAYTALVSGGFTLFTGPISRALGFEEHRSNTLIVADGKLTGTVGEPILGADAKLASLRELTATHGLAATDTLAVGDGANDLPMLMAAGLGVAFRAKPKVAASARARVEHTDLATLLYFQGYRDEEFAR
jgi:phosphoserine phosphatase